MQAEKTEAAIHDRDNAPQLSGQQPPIKQPAIDESTIEQLAEPVDRPLNGRTDDLTVHEEVDAEAHPDEDVLTAEEKIVQAPPQPKPILRRGLQFGLRPGF